MNEWTQIKYKNTNRQQYQKKVLPKAIKHYWMGFDNNGNEKWFIELDNGIIIPNNNYKYEILVRQFFPNDIVRHR